MRCLSIRAAWAHAIIHLGKDVENRSWATRFRGRFLVHASATKDWEAWALMSKLGGLAGVAALLPSFRDLRHGGIIGSVELTDCGVFTSSPWWIGPMGFKLANARACLFIPYKARLGFFEVPDHVIAGAA
jgi:hypothetical protein